MQIHELQCFGNLAGQGNPALVIAEDDSSIDERSKFAKMRNTTCVFLDPCDDPGVVCSLDYFYPHTRSPLCLHATLAAAFVLLGGKKSPVVVKTALRGQQMSLSRLDGEYFVHLSRQTAPPVEVTPSLVRSLLAAPDVVLPSACVVASVGSPKLLIEVVDLTTLYALHPNLALISDWGKRNGVSGCYVYCRLGDGRFEGRNFNHLDPALEDSATGVAAGALTGILGHGMTLQQGFATGKSCCIVTSIEGDLILVGGKVEK
jgi:PhzF family phenazine biosynthesis protein